MTPILILGMWVRHGQALHLNLTGVQYRRAKFLIDRLNEEQQRGDITAHPSLAFRAAKELADELFDKYFQDHKVLPFRQPGAKIIPFRRP